MQTNNSSSQQNCRSNQVSPVGGGPGINQAASRKRKQDELADEQAAESVAIASARRSDAKEIELIVKDRLFSKEPHVVSVAMEKFSDLLGDENINRAHNRTVAFHCGAHLAFVKAMNGNKDSGYATSVLSNGCIALAAIAAEVKQFAPQGIIRIGGLQVCLEALQNHPGSSDVHQAGLCLIGNLWWYPDVRKTVADQGGLTALMKSMKSHKQHSAVQDYGCYALRTFVVSRDDSPTWAKMAVDAGGIEAVIEAMSNHPNKAKLQEDGCTFLSIVANSHDDYRNKIFDAKGLTLVAEALRIHKDNDGVVTEAQEANKAIIGASNAGRQS